jgi:putative phosphotransacetylase
MKTLDEELVRTLVKEVLAQLPVTAPAPGTVSVGISARHVHLSVRDLKALFGTTYQLRRMRELKQPGQFAAEETLTLVGPKGTLGRVRVLGPERKQTQVEISRSDALALGVEAPVRQSGDHRDTPGLVLVGPLGAVTLTAGCIVAARHLHLSPADGVLLNLKDKDRIGIAVTGERDLLFNDVLVRCGPEHATEFHCDTDEGNGAGICGKSLVTIVR